MSTQPNSEEQGKHSHDAHEAAAIVSDNDELEGIKMVALESAELATRSANLAVGAGENMKKATLNLEQLMKANKKQHQIMLGIAGGLMFITAIVFATSIFTLKSRIGQMDAMLASLSKRVVELNDSMEMVGSVNEGLQAMVVPAPQESAAHRRRRAIQIDQQVQGFSYFIIICTRMLFKVLNYFFIQ